MASYRYSSGHRRKSVAIATVAILLAVILIVVSARSALAHTRVEVGPYVIVVGWLVEPPIIGERNALTVAITREDQPVEGVEATLDAELLYAGRSFRTNLNPTETPGLYTAEIFPTVRGQYAVRLFGSLEDMAIDEVIEPEEVFPADRIQFPEPQPDPRELQEDITALELELQTARTLALAGVGIGVLGLVVAAFGLFRRR